MNQLSLNLKALEKVITSSEFLTERAATLFKEIKKEVYLLLSFCSHIENSPVIRGQSVALLDLVGSLML